jgi:hypothetical protein
MTAKPGWEMNQGVYCLYTLGFYLALCALHEVPFSQEFHCQRKVGKITKASHLKTRNETTWLSGKGYFLNIMTDEMIIE